MKLRTCAMATVAAVVFVGSVLVAAPVTTVTVQNTADAARPAGPVTFGMIFAKGDVKETVAAGDRPTQVDVKRRWPDGSVKHAILTVALPATPAGGTVRLPLRQGVAPPSRRPSGRQDAGAPASRHRGELNDLPPVEVTFKIHNGPTVTATLANALKETERPVVWLSGEQAVETLLKTAPADTDGKPDPDLVVRFHVRHYPAVKSTRVVVVVENCQWTSPGNVPYDVTIRAEGKVFYAGAKAGMWPTKEHGGKYAEYLGHPKGTRWVKRFWIGRALDDVHVRYDVTYLVSTGLLPRYDPTIQVPEKPLAKMATNWDERAATDILQRGSILAYFPTTGGRSDIGPLPGWTALYVLSQDPRGKMVTFGNGDLSGSCPVHLRDPKTDWYINLDEHPTYSHNPRGTRERIKPRDTTGTPWIMKPRSHFSVDAAHQPSLAYVPYLFSGDYYYLEEMGFWAAHNMVTIHYAYRKADKGLLTPNQVRGVAWTLRNLVHVAALAPDGSKEKAYFEAKLDNNLKHLSAFATGPDASPIGIYTRGATHAYTRGWPPEWRSRYYSMPGWQHNFLAWAAAHAVDHGYETAVPFRDHMMKFTIGILSHPDEITPFAGTAYFVFIGERFKKKPTKWCKTWREVSDLTYKAPGFKPRKVPTGAHIPDFGGSYSYIARAVLLDALRCGHSDAADARKALAWLDAHLPNRRAVMAANPKWAFSVPTGT